MLYLFVLEWKKMQNYLVFRILILLYLVLLPGMLMTLKNIQVPKEVISNDVFFMFPSVWNYLGYIGNWLGFFIFGFLAVLSVTNEYSNRTLRQNIISGLSRQEFFSAKFVFTLAVSTGATLYFIFVALVVGFFNTETIYMSKVWQEASIIPRFFLMCFGYMSFGMMLGLLLRRTGLTLFLYLTYVMFLESILRWVVHRHIVNGRSMLFYPMNAVEDLTPLPLPQAFKNLSDQSGFSIFLTSNEAIVTTIIYCIIFWILSFLYMKKADF